MCYIGPGVTEGKIAKKGKMSFSIFIFIYTIHLAYLKMYTKFENTGSNRSREICDGKFHWRERTRNVSMGHGCPRYCQIRINRALSFTKGHNSNNNKWILSIIKLDLHFMITYLCMKYESNTKTYSKDIARKPFFIRRSRAITLIKIG